MAKFLESIKKKFKKKKGSSTNNISMPSINADGELADFWNRSGITLVDIGARGGNFHFGNLELIKPWVRYVAFEPDSSEASNLETKLRETQNWPCVTVVPYAISSLEGKSRLFITKQPGLSSLLEPDQAIANTFYSKPLYEIEKDIEIPSISLDRAANQFSFSNAAFLKLDTQGSELDIMKSGLRFLKDELIAIYVK